MQRIDLVASASEGEPAAQLREALSTILAELVAAGGAAAHIVEMRWTAPLPARFHPRRRDIDLAFRDILGGLRPKIQLELGAGTLRITAVANLPPPHAGSVVWRDYTAAQVAAQMTPRNQVPSMRAVLEADRERAAAFRTRWAAAAHDLYYGRSANESLDLFYPAGVARPPLWVFIHGGYWQATDKCYVWHRAEGMLNAGYAVATPNYDLCPEVTLEAIVAQLRRCLRFLHDEADALAVDRGRMHLAGKSAGGHLAALLACDRELDFIRSTLPISGIYDLTYLPFVPMGKTAGVLDAECAARLSPLRYTPNRNVRVGVAVGAAESDEFKRQAAELARLWYGFGITIEGRHHFNADDDLFKGGALLDLARRIATT